MGRECDTKRISLSTPTEKEWILTVYDVELCSDWLKHAAQVQSEVCTISVLHAHMYNTLG